MATRKDLLKAQSFTTRRLIAAFVDRDPDDPTPPLKRVGTATFVSVLLGVVGLAGAAIFGLIVKPGDPSWQAEGQVISDTASGRLFVWAPSGQLVPVRDITSARLIAGDKSGSKPAVVNVKTSQLAGFTQLGEVGIVDAPRQLPDPSQMTALPLRVCSSSPVEGRRYLTVQFGAEPASDDGYHALVARARGGQLYMVFGGSAHKLYMEGDVSPVTEGLTPIDVGDAWLASLPLGSELVPHELQAGATASEKGLFPVGALAVIKDADGEQRYYVQLDRGLSRVSYMDMRLIQERYDVADPSPITQTQLSQNENIDTPSISAPDIPMHKPVAPPFGAQDASVCAVHSADDQGRVALVFGAETPDVRRPAPQPGSTADAVVMPSLHGALLQSSGSLTTDALSYLVVDGRAYPVPDLKSRTSLGFGDVAPIPVPPALISVLPQGLPEGLDLSISSVTTLSNR